MRDYRPYNYEMSFDGPRRPVRSTTRSRRARVRRRREQQLREQRYLKELDYELELEFELELEYERELQFERQLEREAMIREELWLEERAFRAFAADLDRPRRLRSDIPSRRMQQFDDFDYAPSPYWRKSA